MAKLDLGKYLGGETRRHATTLFEKVISKIKNDKVRRVLNFELANTAANHKSEILNSQRNLISQDKQQKRNHKFWSIKVIKKSENEHYKKIFVGFSSIESYQ